MLWERRILFLKNKKHIQEWTGSLLELLFRNQLCGDATSVINQWEASRQISDEREEALSFEGGKWLPSDWKSTIPDLLAADMQMYIWL